jgi:hypothetical protein
MARASLAERRLRKRREGMAAALVRVAVAGGCAGGRELLWKLSQSPPRVR